MADSTRLDITVEEELVDRLTGLLVRHVSFGWEEQTLPTGETRFRIHCDNPELLGRLRAELALFGDEVRLEECLVPDQDWTAAWREFFTPVPCGRFLVLPPWRREEATGHRLSLLIEPKSAFGTGHHNTTVLCLEALSALADEGRLRPDMRFFDVGTGTGILGIACALLGLSGLGVDIDPVAVSNAEENARLNQVTGQMRILPGSAAEGAPERYDLVLANILAGPLRELAPEIMDRLKPGGALVLSGLLDVQADAVEAAYAPLGKARRLHSGDWVALVWPLA